ncbi:MAG TPA: YIP1 family protein [Gemmatimonadales bacterium]|nr:YIP1 family protein [Gemmatimonadales bacterium]
MNDVAKPGLADCAEIFYAPSGVFERRRGGEWAGPFFVFVIAMVLLFFATRGLLQPMMDAETNRSLAKLAANPNTTPEQLEAARSMGAKFAAVGVLVFVLVIPFLSGLVLKVVSKVAGAAVTLKQSMAVGVLSLFPMLLSSVVGGAQGAVMDESAQTGRYAFSIGPARFLDPDTTSPMMMAVAGHFDLFSLWIFCLMGLGVKVIGRTSTGTAIGVAVGMWAVSLLPSLLGGLFS